MQGDDKTYHLAEAPFFASLKRKPLLINSCRGEVVATGAVKEALKQGLISGFVCDCWENEPDIDQELLSLTMIATPHIAGYSKDGKATGTKMSVHAISDFFDLGLNKWEPSGVELPRIPVIEIDGKGKTEQDIIGEAILHTYDIRKDDEEFRKDTSLFEQLRGDYPVRREFPAYTVKLKNTDEGTGMKLKELGLVVSSW